MSSRPIIAQIHRTSFFAYSLLLSGGLVLSSLVLSGCGGGDQAAGQAPVRPPSLVRVDQLQKKLVSRKILVVGTVTPVRTSVVASGANGVVEYIKEAPPEHEASGGKPADPSAAKISPGEPEPTQPDLNPEIEKGQYVTEGTVLSVLRMQATNDELAEARALLRERQHKYEAEQTIHPKKMANAEAMKQVAIAVETNARQKWERTQKLFSRGAANDGELEDAQERWKAATQALVAADENLEQVKAGKNIEQAKASFAAQQAHVDYLETEKAKRTTKAPISGFVVEQQTYVGQWLAKGDPVVTLAKMDEVDVMVNVDQADIPFVRLGQTVDVAVEGADPVKCKGRIVQIVPRSDWEHGSRGFPVVVRIHNRLIDVEVATLVGETKLQKVPALKAGMMAHVTILGPAVETLLAPKDSLVRTTRGTNVFVFDPKDPSAKLDPKNPTMGGVRQIAIEADLNMSDGKMIGIRPAQEMTAGENPLKAGVWVVTEGGERFAAPVQDNVNALSPLSE